MRQSSCDISARRASSSGAGNCGTEQNASASRFIDPKWACSVYVPLSMLCVGNGMNIGRKLSPATAESHSVRSQAVSHVGVWCLVLLCKAADWHGRQPRCMLAACLVVSCHVTVSYPVILESTLQSNHSLVYTHK